MCWKARTLCCDWIKGTALVPILAVLDAGEQKAFMERLAERLAEQYPPESDGRTLFPFRRRFIIAVHA